MGRRAVLPYPSHLRLDTWPNAPPAEAPQDSPEVARLRAELRKAPQMALLESLNKLQQVCDYSFAKLREEVPGRENNVEEEEEMISVEVDTIALAGGKPLGQAVLTKLLIQQSDPLLWPQDRYLIGWAPWIGFGKGSVLECHLMLFHRDQSIFLLGPHKENSSVVYDCTRPDFFPSGYGRLIKTGEPLSVQLVANPTGAYAGVAANARVFSVLADSLPSPIPQPGLGLNTYAPMVGGKST